MTNGGEYMTTAVSDNVCIRHIDNIGIATLLKVGTTQIDPQLNFLI